MLRYPWIRDTNHISTYDGNSETRATGQATIHRKSVVGERTHEAGVERPHSPEFVHGPGVLRGCRMDVLQYVRGGDRDQREIGKLADPGLVPSESFAREGGDLRQVAPIGAEAC